VHHYHELLLLELTVCLLGHNIVQRNVPLSQKIKTVQADLTLLIRFLEISTSLSAYPPPLPLLCLCLLIYLLLLLLHLSREAKA
jgi:hypothetical protein